MSRGRLFFLLASLLVVLPIVAVSLGFAATKKSATEEEDSLFRVLGVFSEVLSLVRQNYVDEPKLDDLMAGALDGTTDAIDPLAVFVPADRVAEHEKAKKVGTSRSGLHILRDSGVAYVAAVDAGSPAAKAEIEPGDILTAIGGRDTRNLPLWEVQGLFAGAAGTEVELRLLRLGEPRSASFRLEALPLPAPTLETVDGVPVLRIANFDGQSATAVANLLKRSKPAQVLVDLRGVASGDPEAAFAVAGLFARGTLGALAGRDAEVQSFTANAAPAWRGRLGVLVDRSTRGAAEVLATVLDQAAGAELIGAPTFGHAGRLGQADLAAGGRLYFTEAFYSGPDKKPLSAGLEPETLVDERSRSFETKDLPLKELILRRGLERMRGEPLAPATSKAAAA